MRITNNLKMSNLLYDIQRLQNQLYRSQQVLSDGIEVNRPSVDPNRADRILGLENQLGKLDQYQKNMDFAKSRLTQSESELQSLLDLLSQARSAAVQGANDTMNEEDRLTLALEVDNYLHETIAIANAKYAGLYIFGGYNTKEAPYTAIMDEETGDIIRVEDLPEHMEGLVDVTVADGERVQSNIPGAVLYQTGEAGEEGDYFQVLIDLRNALRTGDQEMIEATIGRLDEAQLRITSTLSKVGSLVERLERSSGKLLDHSLNATEELSELQDADVTEWIGRYQLDQIALQNAMEIGADLLKISLLNYL